MMQWVSSVPIRKYIISTLLLLFLTGCQTPAISAPKTTTAQPAATRTAAPLATHVSTPVLTATPASPLGVAQAQLKGMDVQFWYSGDDTFIQAMKARVAAFDSGNPWGIQVEGKPFGSPGAITDQVGAAMTADQRPDVVLSFPEVALSWENGEPLLTDLNPYITDPVWGLTAAEQADFPAGWWAEESDATRRLGLPAFQTAQTLLYNHTWAAELGFTQPPANPQDFQTQVCAAAKVLAKDSDLENNGKGGWIASPDLLTDLDWISAFDGSLTPDAKTGYTLTQPQLLNTFTFLSSLFTKNCAWTSKTVDPGQAFAARQALIISAAIEDIPLQEAAFTAAKNKDEWTALPFPGKDGQPVFFASGPSYLLMQKDPARQLAGWLFMRWMDSPENQAALSQSTGVYPARLSAQAALKAYAGKHPQWALGLSWLADAHYPPARQDWTRVAPIVEDAIGQLYSTTTKPLQPEVVVNLLVTSIQEVGQH
jgi:ABC-type glycerol-3-phosphate transport system substrate-binding protein